MSRRQSAHSFTAFERRAVFSLAGIFGLRMFGLFLILPVFAIYATELEGATPFLIGVTLGAYGLTQAALQLPFGVLSDRWHRKNAIVMGLIIFAIGSMVAGLADSIYGVLLGRLVQGAGAISAAVIALMADLTREEQRTKAMAIIGVGIGFVFMLSMILGPLLANWIGVKGIFLLTAIASVLAIPILLKVTPEAQNFKTAHDAQSIWAQINQVLADAQLRQLDFGIFALHAVLTSLFVVIPFSLIELGGLDKSEHWKVFSAVMVIGVIGMLPFIMASHQRKNIQGAMRLAVLMLCLSSLLMMLSVSSHWWGLLAGLALFFIGFNTLEAMLPSLISRVAPMASKGTATGIYNSAQFFGVFVGGSVSGWLSGAIGFQAVFMFSFALLLLWLLLIFVAKPIMLYESELLHFKDVDKDAFNTQIAKLAKLEGVVEISKVADEPMAYLKFDPDTLDKQKVEMIIGQSIQ